MNQMKHVFYKWNDMIYNVLNAVMLKDVFLFVAELMLHSQNLFAFYNMY